ncbi:ribbon-helix-helix domain-containing protein [Flexibacterium corallicola]|uniref:ribbon-helix-helix domain-containing protein n=1 Tax=Flexibacterium corallicola TaxID=3037259 RepID=UPI00286EDBFB|nr:ribbon-helix-helix domain-containing protein [Pseudovibrio sp. M1P-2-3]
MTLIKRSITLHGHRTSIALEPEFWEGLQLLATSKSLNLTRTVAIIDDQRDPEASLSSCIRVAILDFYRNKVKLLERPEASLVELDNAPTGEFTKP